MNVLFSREATNNNKQENNGFSLVLDTPEGSLVLGVIPNVVEHMNFPPFHFPIGKPHKPRTRRGVCFDGTQPNNQQKTETTINNKSTNLRWLPETINKTKQTKNSEQINKPRNKTKQDRVLA